MKKLLITYILTCLLALTAFAQRTEVGVFAGGSYYLGDLNPDKQFGNTSPAFGLVYRYNLSTRWALKMNGIYGTLRGDDASSSGWNKQRNLSFRSHILDFSGQIELNFFPYFTGSSKYNFSPYIFTGFSIFSFNPKAKYKGEWVELQPLGTEGQGTTAYPGRKTYGLTQLAFPFGVGFKISVSKHVCLGLEWSYRKTFTDYIDDVSTTYPDPVQLAAEKGELTAALSNRSIDIPGEPPIEAGMQRGNANTKDWYSFAGVTLTIKINSSKEKGCRDYQKKRQYDEFFMGI
ncbi:MAG TPA: DUF6089 family protein [Bacteroidales bacterium]|nr:DUF6089 family protein [Bacteroidales bacterium]HSA42865.1 DUF6089 family protein [Bacteroidales bacterium]